MKLIGCVHQLRPMTVPPTFKFRGIRSPPIGRNLTYQLIDLVDHVLGDLVGERLHLMTHVLHYVRVHSFECHLFYLSCRFSGGTVPAGLHWFDGNIIEQSRRLRNGEDSPSRR